MAIPLMLLAAIILGPLAYRGYRLSLVPDIGEPFDIEAFSKVEIADEDNAFVEYQAAVAALKPASSVASESEIDAAVEGGWAAASEGVRHWLEDNRLALEIWRRGTSKPDALYYQPAEMSIDTLLPVTQELRTIARLARIEASRLEAEGLFEEAWGWHRALFRCSRHTGRYGCLIERLVGVACHGLASDGINRWAAMSGVDASLLRQALQSVKDDYALTAPTSRAEKTEYLMSRRLFGTASADGVWEYLTNDSLGGGIPSPGHLLLKAPAKAAMFVYGEPEVSCRVLRLVVCNHLSHIDTPRQERPPQTTGLGLFESPGSSDPRTREFSPAVIERCLEASLFAKFLISAPFPGDSAAGREEARQAALVIALALQWYYRDHQTFPETLQPLVGQYLDEIPLDPFGKPGDYMRYRRDGDKATVWSVGEDGIDNGGDVAGKPRRDEQDIGYTVPTPVAREP